MSLRTYTARIFMSVREKAKKGSIFSSFLALDAGIETSIDLARYRLKGRLVCHCTHCTCMCLGGEIPTFGLYRTVSIFCEQDATISCFERRNNGFQKTLQIRIWPLLWLFTFVSFFDIYAIHSNLLFLMLLIYIFLHNDDEIAKYIRILFFNFLRNLFLK